MLTLGNMVSYELNVTWFFSYYFLNHISLYLSLTNLNLLISWARRGMQRAKAGAHLNRFSSQSAPFPVFLLNSLLALLGQTSKRRREQEMLELLGPGVCHSSSITHQWLDSSLTTMVLETSEKGLWETAPMETSVSIPGSQRARRKVSLQGLQPTGPFHHSGSFNKLHVITELGKAGDCSKTSADSWD
jgi:hypothetical protein